LTDDPSGTLATFRNNAGIVGGALIANEKASRVSVAMAAGPSLRPMGDPVS